MLDVIVSKLKRLHGDDTSDIEAMADRGGLERDVLGVAPTEIDLPTLQARAAELAKREGATTVTGTTTAKGKQAANEVDGEV